MMGLDGWVYWTKGAFAEQNHDLIRREESKLSPLVSSKAAHIYRRHPRGGPIDRLMTGGMDNPTDLTFTPEGEILFCSTFLHHPGNGLRDGIAHAPRGGLFGKPQKVLEGHWSTGALLEPIANLGPAAPACIEFLQSNDIPNATPWFEASESTNVKNRFLVSAQFNLQKVGLHRLVASGASFQTQSHDLLTADRIDFHPVDILQESPNSLLVFDTGGWYDLCCPSSGSDQSIARGGIYRLKTKAASESTHLANNANVTHHERLADARIHKLWEIARELTDDPDQREKINQVMEMLSDSDPTIQQAAAHIVGLNRWTESAKPLEYVLQSESPAAVRAALESLGIVGDGTSVAPILRALKRFPDDRFILHSAIYALLEIGDVNELLRVVELSIDDDDRYASIYALYQLKKLPQELSPKLVKFLTSKSKRLRELSLACLTSSSEGTSLCIPFVLDAWNRDETEVLAAALPVMQLGAENTELKLQFAAWLRTADAQSISRQNWLLDSIRGSRGASIPTEWIDPLSSWIKTGSEESVIRLAVAIQSVSFQKADSGIIANALHRRVEKTDAKPEVMLKILAASPRTDLSLSERNASVLIQHIAAPESPYNSIAEVSLSRVNLLSNSAISLIKNLGSVPPLYLQTTIDTVLRCNDPKLDELLLKTLRTLPSVKSLTVDRVMNGLSGRSDIVKKEWKSMIESATIPTNDIVKSIDDWMTRLPAGDAARGYQVFRSSKAACSGCHQVGYIGGRLGPELSKIGKSRTRRDLVEAIVFPNFRMAQGFYSTRILTSDGQVFNGLLSNQSASHVELLCGVDKVCKILKNEIEEQIESNVSVMPSGLEQQISIDDFADLLAFLESKQ